MLHDRPRIPSQPFDPDNSATGERDLAAELARIMARPPRRAGGCIGRQLDGGKPEPAGEEPDETDEARSADAADAMEDTAPPPPMPAWARARRSRRLAHNARMVIASVIAVVVVVAIIGGTSVALFGGPRDVAQLKRLLLPASDRGLTSAQ